MSQMVAAVGAGIALAGIQLYGAVKTYYRKDETAMQLALIDARVLEDRAYWENWFLDHPNVPRHIPERRPLRLLSLDGGGVRGIVSLIILQQIMQEVAAGARPCEYFDLIGGTSTGGLIAIMLGRLRMSIQECIDCYTELSKDVFYGDWELWSSANWNVLSGHKFSGEKLEKAVKTVVEKYGGATGTQMYDDPVRRGGRPPCRTFLVAIPGCNVPRPPKLFRTYDNRFQRHSADQCQIWEAARATSCAPSFFPDIQVEGVYYSDGGLGYNNPSHLVLQEARSLWGPSHAINCLLSIGTGSVESFMHRTEYAPDKLGFIKVFGDMAIGCERVHQELAQDYFLEGTYWRFNPKMDEKIGLDEWRRIDELKGIAWQYLVENDSAVRAFAGATTRERGRP
ncbi:hypothetical protein FRC01_001151 [Tulasnella sp. 417]|nr:hypothetical protein FRC01_001151 [Tulasnella sp. 417]